ncbi:MAG: hypothetical protein IKV56_00755, partial [Kiritimatiellae bacterium]|nr:hypothetical protein [Kiritimatiellia bacterium]
MFGRFVRFFRTRRQRKRLLLAAMLVVLLCSKGCIVNYCRWKLFGELEVEATAYCNCQKCCDWEFDKERYPDNYTKALADQGVKLSLWQLPYVRQGSKAFEEFKAVDGFVKNKNGEMYDLRTLGVIMYDKPEPIGIIDFTNPKAVEVYQELLRRLFSQGVSVIKTDFGEAVPEDGVYYDGTSGYRMHNLYPLLYNQAAYEVTKEMHGE